MEEFLENPGEARKSWTMEGDLIFKSRLKIQKI